MGGVVYQSYLQLQRRTGRERTDHHRRGRAVPRGAGSAGGWARRLDGLHGQRQGRRRCDRDQFEAFTEQCPDTKVVLAGYSQGAMVIHRNLYDLADDPHVAAALLIADGDRLPVDTTINLGSTAVVPGTGKGVAQEHSFLASTNTSTLPPAIGARTVSVCDVGDPVCDYDPDPTDGCRPPASRYTPRTRPPRAVRTPGAHRSTTGDASAGTAPTSTIELTAHGD